MSKILYDFSVNDDGNNVVSLDKYRGKALLIVNTASKCGFTPQYDGLEELQKKFEDRDFSVLAFPCNQFGNQEPGTNEEIQEFCSINFQTSFPVMGKIDVIGKNAHPFYQWARKSYGLGAIPKWNFHKIVIDKNGVVINTFASFTKPTSKKMIKVIEKAIKS